MADVLPKPVDWLWPGYVAIGKLAIIMGDPGLGKSLMALDRSSAFKRKINQCSRAK